MRARPAAVSVVLLTVLFTAAPAQLILISRQQEIEIGKEVAQELERQYGVWNDPSQTRRVERIGRSLVAVCDRKDMPYTFKILNERKELNAVTAPGGFIYITRALLEALDNDDELAFVLGHEIGHVCGDHIRKQISQAMAGSLLLDILTGGASQVVRIGTNLMFALYQRGYSRNHERDADARGVRYMKAAGYNPIAAITALKKLGTERYRGINKWFATHPDVPERIQRIAAMLGVDPDTLQPLPKSGAATLEGVPSRSAPLFFVANGAAYCLPPNAATPVQVWQLDGRAVERLEVDGETLWLLVRDGDDGLVHIARRRPNAPTQYLASFYAQSIHDFRRSPNRQWLAVFGTDDDRPVLKVFRADGQEVPIAGRTPLGKPLAVGWTANNRLVVLTERLGNFAVATIVPGNGARFTDIIGLNRSPTQAAIGPTTPLWVLVGTTLHQMQWTDERAQVQPVLQGVTAFAARGQLLAVVQEGNLTVHRWNGHQWQRVAMVDDRAGVFANLTLSADGQWLAYTYQARSDDPPQLWLAHLPTQRLWRVAVNATAPTFGD